MPLVNVDQLAARSLHVTTRRVQLVAEEMPKAASRDVMTLCRVSVGTRLVTVIGPLASICCQCQEIQDLYVLGAGACLTLSGMTIIPGNGGLPL
jgi:hypothetical protein